MRDLAASDDAEQAVYGFDTWKELALHPPIADAYAAAGYGCGREVRFPGDRRHGAGAAGARCDLVLTPGGRPLATPETAGTLFAGVANTVEPEAAYWLEVKRLARQSPGGRPRRGPLPWRQALQTDLRKLASDGGIRRGGLLLVVFDTDIALARATAEAAAAESPAWTGDRLMHFAIDAFDITERTGHGGCALLLIGLDGRDPSDTDPGWF